MGQTGRVFLHAGIWLGLGLLIYVFFLRQEAPPPRLLGPDSVELQRTRDGHFYIDGRILAQPIRFLIDTGASTVSVSERLARQAGLGCDRVATFSTANGHVQGCTTRVERLLFGPFEVRDVGVVILPNLGGDALLGMNVLRRVRMEQAGDRLRLSAQ
ncbi:MAG: TIGR02281 family clan AA aspartic protease [Thiobacillus sp.]|nr:TIGR02281 family clan AA aspartic protease [Thiobacillus sp.]